MAKWRIAESVAGFRQLLQLLAEHAERIEQPIPVALETAKGLLPAALRAAGDQLFSINPLAVSRYRDRHVAAGPRATSVTRWCWPTSCAPTPAAHRPLPADSELAASQHPGAGPGPAGRGLGAPASGEQAALATARVGRGRCCGDGPPGPPGHTPHTRRGGGLSGGCPSGPPHRAWHGPSWRRARPVPRGARRAEGRPVARPWPTRPGGGERGRQRRPWTAKQLFACQAQARQSCLGPSLEPAGHGTSGPGQ